MKKSDVTAQCVACGNEYRRPPSNMGPYCSRRCWYDSKPRTPLSVRLWRHVDKTGGADACWNWTGAKLKTGYGTLNMGTGQGSVRAHRVAYEDAHGPITDGLHVMHSCDNPLCCNPAHLSLGTPKMNNDDKIAKGRDIRGEAHHGCKLTDEDVVAMRAAHAAGVSGRKLAKLFGMSEGGVSQIVNGKARIQVQPQVVSIMP